MLVKHTFGMTMQYCLVTVTPYIPKSSENTAKMIKSAQYIYIVRNLGSRDSKFLLISSLINQYEIKKKRKNERIPRLYQIML